MLRPIVFDQRSAQFLLHDHSGDNNWRCVQLPDNDNTFTFGQLLRDHQSNHRLVQISEISQTLKVLSAFETLQFIHVLLKADSDESLILEFPRYDLSFELDPLGKLQSRNYVGWHLAQCQSLRDELIGYDKYLVLHQECDDNTPSPWFPLEKTRRLEVTGCNERH